jgi:DNA-binding LacI/PurR family transcriptional regulator
MVTMSEVAKAAGVSRATASYALRNDPRIIPSTAEKVRKAAYELNYTANLSARSLRSGHNGVIGVAIFELDKPYPSEMSAAISREANRHGLQAIVQQTSNSKEGEIAVLQKVTSQLCDATIFSPGNVSAEEIRALAGDKPIVLLDDISNEPIFDTVLTPCEEGSECAIKHLIDIGCEDIVVLGPEYESLLNDEKSTTVSNRRLAGALKAFDEAGFSVDETNFVHMAHWDSNLARIKVHDLLATRKPVDGLYCLTDSIAMGAMRGLADCGMKVPEDIAVVGFDGISEGEYLTPSLSTVRTNLDDLASKAVSLLVQRMNENAKTPIAPQRLTAKFDLLKRESTSKQRIP